MSILVDSDTTFIVQGITGREAVNLTRECLDYGAGARVVGGGFVALSGGYDCRYMLTRRVEGGLRLPTMTWGLAASLACCRAVSQVIRSPKSSSDRNRVSV